MDKKLKYSLNQRQDVTQFLRGLLAIVFALHAIPSVRVGFFEIDKWAFGLFIFFGVVSYSRKLFRIVSTTPLRFFCAFTVVSYLVNGYYFINLGDSSFLMKSHVSLGIFLFAVILHVLLEEQFEKTINHIIVGSLIAVLISLSALFIIDEPSWSMPRALFTNQNQLSRFGLFFSVFISILFLKKESYLRGWIMVFVLGLGLFFSLATASRAVIGGFGILLGVLVVLKVWKIAIGALALCIVIYTLFTIVKSDHTLVDAQVVIDRFQEDRVEDSLIGRGYARIFSNYRFLVYGAGESGLDRFETTNGKYQEIHSTLGSILFCYGILAFTLFCFYWYGMLHADKAVLLLLIPIFFHSLFHNDIRNIHFISLPLMIFHLDNLKSSL